MTLGGDLGAHQYVDLALLHPLHQGADILAGLGGVGGEDFDAGVREAAHGFFRHPLDARAYPDQAVLGPALRAQLGLRHGKAGGVTDQTAGIAMLHQPAIRLRAFHLVTAGLAQDQRREAPAVQIEQGLLAPLQRFGDRFDQRRGQPFALLRRRKAQI
jgi:hypothetical protein